MSRHIGMVTLVVRDYDEAIAWYTGVLGFSLISDTALSPAKRWVVVAPEKDGAKILLARADNPAQTASIGNQTGGRVALFLHTDDFAADHAAMVRAGVHFLEEPRHETYGSVAVFEDLYGNTWDLLQLK
ncbi:VOC family protein [Phyllobacterium myrsinacearum]|uniref:Extradiol dioxygenase n=1 Tax=Phyllobacterium myrsinacearum TaxID=28101 RepID=A0A2S9JAE9_9HYPH|nr:VOC family protein [Phyllobacterium myrsinacearum]PRD49750.1 extradiol dioxygenase [Phyllobacterium myrsinacearum]PWV94659.1 catechol 2,3-dioxygenase-like lactoylglutathione lyase family enzyme [Phyllobacterium myrsinacearum]RZV07232.1 catechol 2,3-dioxygenase-like lactoylglutathione lyase family enzyme [Phyllobacterium myrsinacearum]